MVTPIQTPKRIPQLPEKTKNSIPGMMPLFSIMCVFPSVSVIFLQSLCDEFITLCKYVMRHYNYFIGPHIILKDTLNYSNCRIIYVLFLCYFAQYMHFRE